MLQQEHLRVLSTLKRLRNTKTCTLRAQAPCSLRRGAAVCWLLSDHTSSRSLLVHDPPSLLGPQGRGAMCVLCLLGFDEPWPGRTTSDSL